MNDKILLAKYRDKECYINKSLNHAEGRTLCDIFWNLSPISPIFPAPSRITAQGILRD